jgi:hypothetical protein
VPGVPRKYFLNVEALMLVALYENALDVGAISNTGLSSAVLVTNGAGPIECCTSCEYTFMPNDKNSNITNRPDSIFFKFITFSSLKNLLMIIIGCN